MLDLDFPDSSIEKDKKIALDAVKEAGLIALKFYKKDFKSWNKGPDNPVTEADYKINNLLQSKLCTHRKDYGWLSEESTDDLTRLTKRAVWVVDPIDGTKAFINRKPEFTICIALVVDSLPIIGIVYNPATEELYEAVRDQGSKLNGKVINVSNCNNLNQASLLASSTSFKNFNFKTSNKSTKFTFVNSIAYRIALVASGKYDATVTLSQKSDWDIAAAILIAQEAGGISSYSDGSLAVFNNKDTLHPNLIVANSALHKKIISIL